MKSRPSRLTIATPCRATLPSDDANHRKTLDRSTWRHRPAGPATLALDSRTARAAVRQRLDAGIRNLAAYCGHASGSVSAWPTSGGMIAMTMPTARRNASDRDRGGRPVGATGQASAGGRRRDRGSRQRRHRPRTATGCRSGARASAGRRPPPPARNASGPPRSAGYVAHGIVRSTRLQTPLVGVLASRRPACIRVC